ncbi:hypothetical protein K469DRAFT_541376, partial [Zopfia rhizophila CBS 207.26]
CQEFCAGYTYFGVQSRRECFCDNTIAPWSLTQPYTECNTPCPANPAQMCGAANRINAF